MDTSSSVPPDGLFDAGLIERVHALDDGRMDVNGGVRKRGWNRIRLKRAVRASDMP